MAVNIVQHPRGEHKQVAFRNNLVSAADATIVRYFTDTDHGSSGSPVCDDHWRVVASIEGRATQAASSSKARTAELHPLTAEHALRAAAGTGLVERLPAFPEAPMDAILEARLRSCSLDMSASR
jgi:hypothetical protein